MSRRFRIAGMWALLVFNGMFCSFFTSEFGLLAGNLAALLIAMGSLPLLFALADSYYG